MRSRAVLFILSMLIAADAIAADVPGAQVVQASVHSTPQRDQLVRTAITASLLSGVVYAQAGERAKAKAFTAAESARMAELRSLSDSSERTYEATLPAACKGHDCEERYAYHRCYSAYLFSSPFYRAVFDKFFSAADQQALVPMLQNSGSVWRDALALPRGSHPFDTFPVPSKDCTTTTFAQPAQTAQSVFGGPAPAAQAAPAAPAVPTAAFNAHADSLRRARAAGVDTTVLGLPLGEPLQLPVCPDKGLFGMLSSVSTTCIRRDAIMQAANQIAQAWIAEASRSSVDVNFDTMIEMPASKCPDWMGSCLFRVAEIDGRVVGVVLNTGGIDKQKDVAAALVQKYKAASQTFWKEWSNEAGNKLLGLNMNWNLPGLTVQFVGYAGGDRNAAGSVLIETDALTHVKAQQEKTRQDEKQKL